MIGYESRAIFGCRINRGACIMHYDDDCSFFDCDSMTCPYKKVVKF